MFEFGVWLIPSTLPGILEQQRDLPERQSVGTLLDGCLQPQVLSFFKMSRHIGRAGEVVSPCINNLIVSGFAHWCDCGLPLASKFFFHRSILHKPLSGCRCPVVRVSVGRQFKFRIQISKSTDADYPIALWNQDCIFVSSHCRCCSSANFSFRRTLPSSEELLTAKKGKLTPKVRHGWLPLLKDTSKTGSVSGYLGSLARKLSKSFQITTRALRVRICTFSELLL